MPDPTPNQFDALFALAAEAAAGQDFPSAALCECMDVVISVDTSLAHLSGALGRRTWVLLPSNPDWRWLIDRDDSPWYPTVKLYRQKAAGDWNEVFARIAVDLYQEFRSLAADPGE